MTHNRSFRFKLKKVADWLLRISVASFILGIALYGAGAKQVFYISAYVVAAISLVLTWIVWLFSKDES